MSFADPWYLLFLFILIPMVLQRRKQGGRIRFSSIATLKKSGKGRFNFRNFLTIFRLMAVIFFVIALARPQKGKVFSDISTNGIDIILAIDTSGSMQALDFKFDGKRANRLHVVKKVVREFVDKRPYDKIGLVVFGDEAFTQCPLTLDHGVIHQFLEQAKIGMVGNSTAIGSAIGTSVKRLKDQKTKSKILILLTDGQNTAGNLTPEKAAELAKAFNIKVYTIGVGSNGEVPFLVDNLFFGKSYQYRRVVLDEKLLKSIADTTGGQYYRATNTDDLKSIYAEIDQLEKTEIKVKQYTLYKEFFSVPLMIGLFFLLLEIVLGHTIWRKIP